LEVDRAGRLEVWNEEDDPFQGLGSMEIHYEAYVRSTLRIGVLGGIIGYATGVLVDMNGCVWFVNPPDAIGEYLHGEAGQVMLVKKDNKPLKADEELRVIEIYDKVDFDFEGINSGSDEND